MASALTNTPKNSPTKRPLRRRANDSRLRWASLALPQSPTKQQLESCLTGRWHPVSRDRVVISRGRADLGTLELFSSRSLTSQLHETTKMVDKSCAESVRMLCRAEQTLARDTLRSGPMFVVKRSSACACFGTSRKAAGASFSQKELQNHFFAGIDASPHMKCETQHVMSASHSYRNRERWTGFYDSARRRYAARKA